MHVASAPSVSRPRLLLATLNRAKARELVALLGDIPYTIVPLAEVPGATLPEETAETYEGNALLKAQAAVRFDGAVAVADDSGLEVDALAGAPGVRSARFGGPGLDDAGRVALLLERLRGVPPERRTARFRCVIAVLGRTGPARTVEGVVEGVITEAPRGAGGFGYDPVFFYPPLGKTFGELSDDVKSDVSHRGRAVRKARELLGAAAGQW
jgi:XTP/dITP diphosphohydrolase